MKKNLKGMVSGKYVRTAEYSNGRVSYKSDLFDRVWYMMQDGKAVQTKVTKISWGSYEVGEETEYWWMVHFVRATSPKTTWVTCETDISLYRTPEDAYAHTGKLSIGIRLEKNLCGYHSESLVEKLRAMGFQEADVYGSWDSFLHAKIFSPLKNGGVTYCYCDMVVYADKHGWHIEPKIPEGSFRTIREALASVKMEIVEFPSDEDEPIVEPTAEQKRINELETIIRNAQAELSKYSK